MKPNQKLGSLAQQPAQQPGNFERQAPKENAEINAKIDAYIQANPRLYQYYQGLDKDRLVRTAMLTRMQEDERKLKYQERELQNLKQWVDQRPELKEKIAKQLEGVASEKLNGAFVNIVRREQQKIGAQITPNQVANRASIGG